jgi:hypothetical protein
MGLIPGAASGRQNDTDGAAQPTTRIRRIPIDNRHLPGVRGGILSTNRCRLRSCWLRLLRLMGVCFLLHHSLTTTIKLGNDLNWQTERREKGGLSKQLGSNG